MNKYIYIYKIYITDINICETFYKHLLSSTSPNTFTNTSPSQSAAARKRSDGQVFGQVFVEGVWIRTGVRNITGARIEESIGPPPPIIKNENT